MTLQIKIYRTNLCFQSTSQLVMKFSKSIVDLLELPTTSLSFTMLFTWTESRTIIALGLGQMLSGIGVAWTRACKPTIGGALGVGQLTFTIGALRVKLN